MNRAGISQAMLGKFTRYVLIGGASVVMYLALFSLARKTLGFNQWVSVLVAYGPVLAMAYLAQNFYTFRYRKIDQRSGVRFFATTLIGLGTLLISSKMLIALLGMEEILANAIGAVLAPVVTFLLQSFWTFPDREGPE